MSSHVKNYIRMISALLQAAKELTSGMDKKDEYLDELGEKGYTQKQPFGDSSAMINKVLMMEQAGVLMNVFDRQLSLMKVDFFTGEELLDFLGQGNGCAGGIRGLQRPSSDGNIQPFLELLNQHIAFFAEEARNRGFTDEEIAKHWQKKFTTANNSKDGISNLPVVAKVPEIKVEVKV